MKNADISKYSPKTTLLSEIVTGRKSREIFSWKNGT